MTGTLGRAAAAFALAAAGLLPGIPAPAQAQPLDELPVRVSVESLSAVLRPGDGQTLRVTGRVSNTGDEPLRRVRARLLLGDPVRSRSLLSERPTTGTGGAPIGDVETLGELGADSVDSLPFAFDLPVDELRLDRTDAHVYRLRIEVRARGIRVGGADTFVPWWPVSTARTGISWVWPLVEPSHRAIGTDFYDDALIDELADGRLGTLLDVAADAEDTPVTWAVDPELVESVKLLAGDHTVRNEPPDTGPAGGRPEAVAWLSKARRALAGGALLTLPYADPDLAAFAGTPLAPDVANAVRLGAERMREILGVTGDPRLAWPPGGELDQRTQHLLTGAGAKGIVVADPELPLQEPLNFTPTAPYQLQAGAVGGVTALVADAGLADLVADGPGEQGRRLAAQRFLAETALITLERPNDARSVVVTPPRVWDPDPGYAAQLLAFSAEVPWLTPQTLPEALRGPVSTAPRTLPAEPDPATLSAGYVRSIVSARGLLERYRSILTLPGDLPALLDNALLRAESARWRDELTAGERLVRTVTAGVRGEFAKLQVATGGVVTLAGTSGRVPVTIVNDLGQPVRIRIRLHTHGRLLLESDCYDGCRPVTIAPGRFTIVVEGEAVSAGLFPVSVELLPPPPDDAPLVPAATLRVRSKSYGRLALIITGGAFALLLAGSVTRLVRRFRNRGTPPEPTAEATAPEILAASDGPAP